MDLIFIFLIIYDTELLFICLFIPLSIYLLFILLICFFKYSSYQCLVSYIHRKYFPHLQLFPFVTIILLFLQFTY